MEDQPEITSERLATFARCRFVHQRFVPYPCLHSIQPLADLGGRHVWRPYTGGPYDPNMWEVVEGGWDHEHCSVCGARIIDGDWYWANEDRGNEVDLCEACHPRVMQLLGRA
jgi:hypothetical protein